MSEISIVYDFLKEIGGLERVMFFQANVLSKRYGTDLLFSYVDNNKSQQVTKDLGLNQKIKISSLGSGIESIDLASALLFPGKMKKIRPKLFISHSFMSSRLCYRNKRRNGTKYVVMIHHPPNFLYGRNMKWANNFPRLMAYAAGSLLGPWMRKEDLAAVKGADLIFANSNYTRKRIREIYGIDSVLLYPPIGKEFKINKKETNKKILNELNIEKKFVYLHGRMIKDKRPDLAVRAVALLKEVDLVISGTIEEEKKIRELIEELGLGAKVHILGRVSQEQLVALYNSAECFLMSAPKEDFGLTVVEAMACGCPVVAWNDGSGPSEVVKVGKNGLLAKPYNVQDMAEQIKLCLKRKWNRQTISESAGAFSEANISRVLEDSIKRVLK